ncbi:MAG: helix-turn-helix domain-containing protein [Chthoniobacteraceae bacterium]
MNGLTLQVPLELPSSEEVRAIIREAAMDCAAKQLAWLTFAEAARHLGVCRKTFERKRRKLGIPVAQIDGIQLVARADLDAILLAHLSAPGATVIRFPSVELRDAQAMKGAA